jgi:hypothetical protein
MLEITGKDYGLPPAPGHVPARLHVVTPGPDVTVTVEAVCTGRMTCPCRRCSAERAERLRGVREAPQPWHPKPLRRAA